MRIVKEVAKLDAVADFGDRITVETQRDLSGGNTIKLCVHVNGETILRIGHIDPSHLDFVRV